MIVLDTHALIWWVNGAGELSANAERAIDDERSGEDGAILVSSITAWEMAMLVERGRLTLTMALEDWLALVESIDRVTFVPVDNTVAIAPTRLPGDFHKDPADRMLVALTRRFNAAIVTADEKIRSYPHVRSVW